MPTYHARSISVHLGTMPLDRTITPHVVLRKGEVAKQQCEDAEKQLRGSRKLDEQSIPLPGDETGLELHWLEDVPFMQVQVKNGCDDTAVSHLAALSNTTRMEDMPEHSIPKALVLHVNLSNQTFISGFEGKTHLKIDVLFNGQLSGCSLIHTNDIRSGAKSLDQIFAGSRIDYLAERPWVILPPRTTLNGKPRDFQKPISAEERWDQINQALLNEAVERGINKHSDLPSTAKFLVSLAKMELPEQVKHVQTPGGKTFGVVDVIISAGLGKKVTSGTRYLQKPERLRDASFPLTGGSSNSEQAQSDEAEEEQSVGTTEPLESDQGFAAGEQEEDSGHSDQQPAPKRRATSCMLASEDGTRHLPTLSNPFPDTSMPFLPPPVQHTPYSSPLWITPSYSQPETRPSFSDGDESLGGPISPTHNHATTRDQYRAYECHMPQDSDLCERRNYFSPGTCSPFGYTSQAHQPTYSQWNSDSIVGPYRSTEHMHVEPYDGGRSFSSPLSHGSRSAHSFLPQMHYTGRLHSPEAVSGLPRMRPCMDLRSPIHPGGNGRQPSMDFVHPYYGLGHSGVSSLYEQHDMSTVSSPGTSVSQNSFSSLPAYTPPYYEMSGHLPIGRRSTYPPIITDCSRGMLPPTGLFTVPQKPRRGMSAMNSKSRKVKPRQSSITVSRLTIAGKCGATIVDHQWAFPQHVVPSDIGGKLQERTPVTNECTNSPDDGFKDENSNICPLSETTIKRLFLPKTSMGLVNEPKDGIQVDFSRRCSEQTLPYLRRHHGVSSAIPAQGELNKTESESLNSHELSEQKKMPQHFKINRTGILGVQGPKAATFLLDDPEEFLREAAALRRSGSSTKSSLEPASRPSVATPVTISSDLKCSNTFSSSPLSSVPPSPVYATMPQLDGPSERRRATLSSFKQQKQHQALLIPKSSGSSDSKKRKAITQSPVKRPRTTKIRSTMDNPPLNQNCMIAFAEGIDPSTKQGVLRQVRGERQGVFKEEYVVLAVRFYIPGN